MERQLAKKLVENVRTLLAQLNPNTLEKAVEIVERYQEIRGFGYIKERKALKVLTEVESMMAGVEH